MTEPNLNVIHKMSQGDQGFEKQLLDIARQELIIEVEEFRKWMECKNHKLAAELVHKIKHKVSLLGMEKSYETVQEFEEQLKRGRLALHPDFEVIIEKMTTFLKESE